MSLNHELNYSLIVYLSNIELKKSEFKTIYKGFIKEYPDYSAEIYYQNIYRIIRSLADNNLLIVEQFNYFCKYTSNYSNAELNNFLLNKGVVFNLQTKLSNEVCKLNNNLEKMRLEIIFFDKYIKEFPLLKDTILRVKENSEQQVVYLESQINVLNKIRSQV